MLSFLKLDMEKMRFENVKGTRDFSPNVLLKRNYVMNNIIKTFTSYGFEELETPILEKKELLEVKYGIGSEIEDSIYTFRDKGDREVVLRFDVTLPLMRFFVNNHQTLPKPFKRFALAPVWRYEEIRPGRYREFYQADLDNLGTEALEADAECLAATSSLMKKLGFEDFYFRLNDRKFLESVVANNEIGKENVASVFRSVDKYEKIGEEGVLKELSEKGVTEQKARNILRSIGIRGKNEEVLKQMLSEVENTDYGRKGVNDLEDMLHYLDLYKISNHARIDPSLIRGWDYYTGPVFEMNLSGEEKIGAVGGGGRYDNLVEKYGGPHTPATGFSLGVERVIDIMTDKNMFSHLPRTSVKVYVASSQEARDYAINVANTLRENSISVNLDMSGKHFDKQLKASDKLGAPYTIVIGPEEKKNNLVTLKDMKTREQIKDTIEKVVEKLKEGP